MVDNFELIKSMFYFNEANDMFFHSLLVLDENDNLVRKMTGLPATPTDLTKFVYE